MVTLRRAVVLQRLAGRMTDDLWPAGYYVDCDCRGEECAPCDQCVDIALGRVERAALEVSRLPTVQGERRRRVRDRFVAGVPVRHVVLPMSGGVRCMPGASLVICASSPWMAQPRIVRASLEVRRSFEVEDIRTGYTSWLGRYAPVSMGAVCRSAWDQIIEPLMQAQSLMMHVQNVSDTPQHFTCLWHCLTPRDQ